MFFPRLLTIKQFFTLLSLVYVALLFGVLLLSRWYWFYPNELALFQQQQAHQQRLDTAFILLQKQQNQAAVPTSLQTRSEPETEIADLNQRFCLHDQDGTVLLCNEPLLQENLKPKFLDLSSLAMLLTICITPLFIFAFLLSQMFKPLQKAIKILQQGQTNAELQPLNLDSRLPIKELRELKHTYNALVGKVLQQQKRLEQLSYTDKLTDIPNRRAFDSIFEKTWHRLSRYPHSMALVIIDIDFFKLYNDLYGHQAGDAVLYRVAQAINTLAKRSDELAARFGGEEFALLVNLKNEEELMQFQTRLMQVISALNIAHAHSELDHQLSVSAGIAWIKDSGSWLLSQQKESWLACADQALYQAKNNGRKQAICRIIDANTPFL